ncbi:17416_t:CDS:2 [Gigaspora rosea]|nr:17416_t:CDS:2 [Gigaspora rosea]
MVEPDPTTIIWRDLDWILAQPDGLNSNNDLIMPLKKMKGIEFQVVQERPPALWVIRKQNRLSEWEESRIAQQDPAELFKFRNGVERAFKSTTIKMTQQWNQQTPDQPPAQPSSPNQPNADNITKRRKKSEDSGKKKKKSIS